MTPGRIGPRPLAHVAGELVSPGGTAKFSLSIGRFEGAESLPEPDDLLKPQELRLLGRGVHERRRTSFLAGRWVAKESLARQTGSQEPAEFCIEHGVFSHPVVTWPPGSPQVTLSHTEGLAAAAAFPETHPMGVDVEVSDPGARSILEDQLTAREKEFSDFGPWPPAVAATLLWTAKEALSKALRTGLTTPFPVLETERWERDGRVFRCSFARFTQYRVWACLAEGRVLAVCYPAVCRIELDGETVFQALR